MAAAPPNPHQFNPINTLPSTAIRSLYLEGKNDPLLNLCLDDENNLLKLFFSWRSPFLTIGTLICLNICTLLVTKYHYPFLTLLCYIMMTQIVVCLVYTHLTKLYLTFNGNSHVSIAEITQHEYKDYFDHESVTKTTTTIVATVIALFNFMVNVYRCVNLTKTIGMVIILFIVAQLARFLHPFLLITWSLTSFTIFAYLSTRSAPLALWYESVLNFVELYDEKYKAPSHHLYHPHDAQNPMSAHNGPYGPTSPGSDSASPYEYNVSHLGQLTPEQQRQQQQQHGSASPHQQQPSAAAAGPSFFNPRSHAFQKANPNPHLTDSIFTGGFDQMGMVHANTHANTNASTHNHNQRGNTTTTTTTTNANSATTTNPSSIHNSTSSLSTTPAPTSATTSTSTTTTTSHHNQTPRHLNLNLNQVPPTPPMPSATPLSTSTATPTSRAVPIMLTPSNAALLTPINPNHNHSGSNSSATSTNTPNLPHSNHSNHTRTSSNSGTMHIGVPMYQRDYSFKHQNRPGSGSHSQPQSSPHDKQG